MRKIMVLVIAALLIVPGAVALAEETQVYTLDGSETDLAKAFLSDPIDSPYCNERVRTIPVNISASIAQWAELSLSATKIEWQVLKPGKYYIKGIQATLQSNGDLYVEYAGFEDLVNDDPKPDVIPTYYACSPGEWISASELNDHGDLVDELETHCPFGFTLYNKIEVDGCKSACEYVDPNGATITVTLAEQKDWIWTPAQ